MWLVKVVGMWLVRGQYVVGEWLVKTCEWSVNQTNLFTITSYKSKGVAQSFLTSGVGHIILSIALQLDIKGDSEQVDLVRMWPVKAVGVWLVKKQVLMSGLKLCEE